MPITIYAGVTDFNITPNGIWYQEAFQHKISRRSPSIGFDYILGNGDKWQFGVGYLYVGKVSSYAEAVADDANYDLKTNTCVGKCLPLSHWYGQGNVQQISFFTRSNYGYWFADIGVSVYRPSWSVDIPDYRPYNEIPEVYKRVDHIPRIEALPTFAIGYRQDKIIVKLSIVPTVAHGDWPAIYRGVSPNLSVGYSF